MREAASRGFWMTTYAPYGYKRVHVQDGAAKRPKLELNPPADAVVRRVFDMVLQGKSILDVTKTLNAEGIPTTNGKKWLKTTIHTMLSHEAYTGTVVWGANAKDGAPPVRVEDAHPAIVSKRDFQKARRLLGSRAPKKVNPRRASSPYLLSGIAKCETCGKAMTAAEAKSGKYTYYICHSLLKRGKGTCKTPRLNAKNFEKIIVDEIRANILTESNIRDLVKLLDEEMDGVARDQRERLQNIEEELEDVKKRLGRIWNHIETTDTEMADASDRIREHRERKEKLEVAAEEARALLKERRQFLDSADTIAAFAAEMSEFLKTSELTETKAFVGSFVKEVVVKPGRAAIVYSIPTPDDSPIGGADAAEIALNGRVMNSVRHGGLRRYGYRHPIARHEPAMESRPSSVALGRRGGCVASRPGLPLQRHVPFAPRHLEGAGARDAASRASGTAVAVVKPELCFLPTIPQQRRHSHCLAEPAGDDGFHHSDHFLNRPVGRFVTGVAATIGE